MTFASVQETTASSAARSEWKFASVPWWATISTNQRRQKLGKSEVLLTSKPRHLTVSNSRQNVQSVKRVRIKFASEKSVNLMEIRLEYCFDRFRSPQLHFCFSSKIRS